MDSIYHYKLSRIVKLQFMYSQVKNASHNIPNKQFEAAPGQKTQERWCPDIFTHHTSIITFILFCYFPICCTITAISFKAHTFTWRSQCNQLSIDGQVSGTTWVPVSSQATATLPTITSHQHTHISIAQSHHITLVMILLFC